MKILLLVLMFVMGAVFGSFLCCQVKRIYLRDKGEKFGKRSICLSCKKQLKWFDNVPILSWLFLRGKCRYCREKIGMVEILAEFLMGIGMLLIGTLLPGDFSWTGLEWVSFGILILLFLVLGFLAIYDGLFGELPVLELVLAGILAIILVVLRFVILGFSWVKIGNLGGAILVLGGIYLALWLISRGKWVGDGDWILGMILGLALGDTWLAIFALFFANLFGCVVMFPMLKGKKGGRIYFGPFLVAAFVIVIALGKYLIELI